MSRTPSGTSGSGSSERPGALTPCDSALRDSHNRLRPETGEGVPWWVSFAASRNFASVLFALVPCMTGKSPLRSFNMVRKVVTSKQG